MPGNVLIIGSGGREHAIIWKLSQSPKVKKIFVAPGSIAIKQVSKAENVDLNIKDFPVTYSFTSLFVYYEYKTPSLLLKILECSPMVQSI